MKRFIRRGVWRGDRQAHNNRRKGMTLVEVSIAIGVAAVAALGFTQSIIGSMVAAGGERELALASEAAREMVETLKGVPFEEAFDTYGWGAAPGPDFAVTGLQALPDDEDGFPMEVIFPSTWGGDLRLHLREDVDVPWLGMPRDLNGDGLIDEADHSGDYMLLPVMVRVEWVGSGGPSKIELRTMLAANGL